MSIITKKNLKNWRWWSASLLLVVFAIIISPLMLIGWLADILSDLFDSIHDPLNKILRPNLDKLKKWVNK